MFIHRNYLASERCKSELAAAELDKAEINTTSERYLFLSRESCRESVNARQRLILYYDLSVACHRSHSAELCRIEASCVVANVNDAPVAPVAATHVVARNPRCAIES